MGALHERRLLDAVAGLVLEEPFFGVLVMQLDRKPDPSCKTMWTDGRVIGFNPTHVEDLPFDDLKETLKHEVMHCAAGHPWRRGGRDPKQWNVAGDFAVNSVLAQAGDRIPDGWLLDPRYDGLSAESIYPRLHSQDSPESEPDPQPDDNPSGSDDGGPSGSEGAAADDSSPTADETDSAQTDDSAADNGSSDGQTSAAGTGSASPDQVQDGANNSSTGSGTAGTGSATEQDPGAGDYGPGAIRDPEPGSEHADAPSPTELEDEWACAVAQAVQTAKSQGKLPGHLKRFAEQVLAPRVDWRAELRRFMQENSRSDYSWTRPNPRYLSQGLYLPALHTEGMGPLVLVADTSLSIGEDELAAFWAEMVDAVDECEPETTWVLGADAAVRTVHRIDRGEPLEPIELGGGGGTDFRPAFAWVDSESIEPAAMIYLTDMWGTFPEEEPDYPVLWVATSDRTAPIGETIHLQP